MPAAPELRDRLVHVQRDDGTMKSRAKCRIKNCNYTTGWQRERTSVLLDRVAVHLVQAHPQECVQYLEEMEEADKRRKIREIERGEGTDVDKALRMTKVILGTD